MPDEILSPEPEVVPPQIEEIQGPPLNEASPQEPPKEKSKFVKKLGPFAAGLLWLATKLKAFGSILLTVLKFGKLGKILLTTGSMFLSVWAYAQIFGFWFAVGFVVLIFVHEMGHVWAAYKMGIPVSAPIFIPFMGALILTKKFGNKLITQDAIIGIGGPILGTVGSIVCVGIYLAGGSAYFLALGYVGFFLNLFNLTPIYPLDGGWIVRAISPILWLLGIAILGYMVVTGQVRNPMIYILILVGIPTMWTEFGAMFKGIPSPVPTPFRWKMGAAYVGLLAVCVVGMSECRAEMTNALMKREKSSRLQVATHWQTPAIKSRPSSASRPATLSF